MPVRGTRGSRLSASASSMRANFVAQLRGPLVVFFVDRFLHLAAQADQLRAAARCRSAIRCGTLADVLASRRGCSRSAARARLEADVVVRAAEPALVAELVKRDAADRAGPLVEPGQFLGRLADGQLLGQHAGHAGSDRAARRPTGVRYCRRVLLAQVQFVRLAARSVP